MRFVDRQDAGRQLAARLAPLRAVRPLVVALPRGGVPVAAEVAKHLEAPLDVLVVRKLGHPRQPELAVGALGEGGVVVLDPQASTRLGVTEADLVDTMAREQAELERRVRQYRRGRPRQSVRDRTVIVVDDGLATGATARAAIEVLRRAGAGRIVLAVPVAPADALSELGRVADEVVCLTAPPDFRAVGLWYREFGQVTDDEVARLLAGFGSLAPDAAGEEEVAIACGPVSLGATLTTPPEASALVVFAHGSGSSRFSARNRFVAGALQDEGIGTLLLDLLTGDEEDDRGHVFDVGLLAHRLVVATGWASDRLGPSLPTGYFGASTGAAAALVAAARLGHRVRSVVSRGGRPDLAGAALADVTAPTLFIVGGADEGVLDLNQRAAAQMVRAPHHLVVIPGATHLFPEPGALEAVARYAVRWFAGTLPSTSTVSGSTRP
jgi:predicted phosphoribosyltransferase/predicted alpha/beta-hydrolase family hydrolase